MLFPLKLGPNIISRGSGTGSGVTETFHSLTIVLGQSKESSGVGHSTNGPIIIIEASGQSQTVTTPPENIKITHPFEIFNGTASAHTAPINNSYGGSTVFENYKTDAITSSYLVSHSLGASTFVANATYNTIGNGYGVGSSVPVSIPAGQSDQVVSNNPSIGGSGVVTSTQTLQSSPIPVQSNSISTSAVVKTQTVAVEGGTITGTVM